MENKIVTIEECPHGEITATCIHSDCCFHKGKWKGTEVPNVSLELCEDTGKVHLICDDMETE